MALAIYSAPDSDSLISQDGLFTKPVAVTFDGRTGGFKEIQLFIRNDDPTYYYTDVVLSLEDNESPTITDQPANQFVWKLSYGDTKPTFNDWANILPANSLNIPVQIGEVGNPDTSTYLPVWVFIRVPANLDIQVFTGVKLVLSGNEVLA